ncbi:MAG: tail protein X [Synergistaceae bacterium]|nr:tail protein X [Synergistaceae bacterium]
MRSYRTIQGDTWDLIALKVYPELGGEKFTSVLMDANPEHVETVIFSAGVELSIPEVSVPVSRRLPPWM